MIQDEDIDTSQNTLGHDELGNIHDDLKSAIENLYPERQTTSRFSIHNPHARFSTNPDQLRQTIKEYKEIGKLPNNESGQSIKFPGDMANLARAPLYNQSFANGVSSGGLVFQKQGAGSGNGVPTSNLSACENLVNQTLSESFMTHNNIDELFNKASNLEAQAKQEDDFFAQLQVNQFR